MHTDDGPDITGDGKGLTVTLCNVAPAAEQPYEFVKLTVTDSRPGIFHVTVTVLSEVPPPDVIAPPGDTAHI
jgi:hypothetical protein